MDSVMPNFLPKQALGPAQHYLLMTHRLGKEWYDSHQHWRLWTFQSQQALHTTSKAWIFRAHQNSEGYILPSLRLRRENPKCFWIHLRTPIISTITLIYIQLQIGPRHAFYLCSFRYWNPSRPFGSFWVGDRQNSIFTSRSNHDMTSSCPVELLHYEGMTSFLLTKQP